MKNVVRKLRPHWRKMTWVVMIFNVIGLLVTVLSAATQGNPNHCTAADKLCSQATDVGTAIGIGIFIALWVAGDVVLGILWLVTGYTGRRRRQAS